MCKQLYCTLVCLFNFYRDNIILCALFYNLFFKFNTLIWRSIAVITMYRYLVNLFPSWIGIAFYLFDLVAKKQLVLEFHLILALLHFSTRGCTKYLISFSFCDQDYNNIMIRNNFNAYNWSNSLLVLFLYCRLLIFGSYDREANIHCTLELSSSVWEEKQRSSIKTVK